MEKIDQLNMGIENLLKSNLDPETMKLFCALAKEKINELEIEQDRINRNMEFIREAQKNHSK